MGIGPIYAVPKLLKRHGLKIDDIDLWELNEAFASQCLYSRDKLGIDPEKYNVNGGSIAIGHPFGMTGARLTGHILQEGRRRKAKWGDNVSKLLHSHPPQLSEDKTSSRKERSRGTSREF